MTTQVHVSHRFDMYVVSVRDNTIIRVEKYLGDTQMLREVQFDDLPLEVQNAILYKLTEKLTDEESN